MNRLGQYIRFSATVGIPADCTYNLNSVTKAEALAAWGTSFAERIRTLADQHSASLERGDYHFLLRRLHSLSGVVPVGAFLIEHLLTNSQAFGPHGEASFNEAVQFIQDLPYLSAIEMVTIFLPLAFHAIYGVVIAMTAKPNSQNYPYMENVRFSLQRITGYIAFLFIIIHLAKFRFAHWFGGAHFMESENFFESTRSGLMEWILPAPVVLAFYVLGLTAAVFHFANGLCTFCITWGITVGPAAQRKVRYGFSAVGMIMLIWGLLSLYAFATAKPAGEAPEDDVVAQVISTDQPAPSHTVNGPKSND
jgi:succinate dehydrogenase / fumarate reductase cytochrome b subunit